MPLDIIYQDEHMVCVNKPQGMLVHRSSIAADTNTFLLQELRDQIGRRVNPIHRLDRKTSGVILFAFESEVSALLQAQFIGNQVTKEYYAIARGYITEVSTLDYDLTNDSRKVQEAITRFEPIELSEIQISSGEWPTSRYSLVKAIPKTGRYHQIRKHLAHLRHPIIGDRPHGCNRQNKFFKEEWGMINMLLHARRLDFHHPITNEPLSVTAAFPSIFEKMLKTLEFNTLTKDL